MTLREGIHDGVPMKEYVADPCPEPSLSSSTIARLLVSPQRAWQRHPRLGGESDYSRRADLGSAAHAMALGFADEVQVVTERYGEKHKLAGEYVLNYQTKRAQAARDEIRAAGNIPILHHEVAAVQAMAKQIERGIVGCGRQFGAQDLCSHVTEQTVIWREPNGAWCRARPDVLFLQFAGQIDIKTCEDAAPENWIRRTLYAGNYDISSAWYRRGLLAVTGNATPHRFLLQEIAPPYDWSIVGLGPEALATADRLVEVGIHRWAECLESGNWPGHTKKTCFADGADWRRDWAEELEYELPHGDDEVFGGDEE